LIPQNPQGLWPGLRELLLKILRKIIRRSTWFETAVQASGLVGRHCPEEFYDWLVTRVTVHWIPTHDLNQSAQNALIDRSPILGPRGCQAVVVTRIGVPPVV